MLLRHSFSELSRLLLLYTVIGRCSVEGLVDFQGLILDLIGCLHFLGPICEYLHTSVEIFF